MRESTYLKIALVEALNSFLRPLLICRMQSACITAVSHALLGYLKLQPATKMPLKRREECLLAHSAITKTNLRWEWFQLWGSHRNKKNQPWILRLFKFFYVPNLCIMQSDVKQWDGMKCITINELWSELQCNAKTKRCTHMCAFLTFSASPGNGPYEKVRPISRTPTKDSGPRNQGPFSMVDVPEA